MNMSSKIFEPPPIPVDHRLYPAALKTFLQRIGIWDGSILDLQAVLSVLVSKADFHTHSWVQQTPRRMTGLAVQYHMRGIGPSSCTGKDAIVTKAEVAIMVSRIRAK
jgi:hypothetical protein